MHVIHEPDDVSFSKVGIEGRIFPIDTLRNDLEFILVDTEKGHETTIVEHESIFTYYVLEGSGYFEVEDSREGCQKGDLIVIPPGRKFTYKGKLKLALIVTPPWREEQEETLS